MTGTLRKKDHPTSEALDPTEVESEVVVKARPSPDLPVYPEAAFAQNSRPRNRSSSSAVKPRSSASCSEGA